MYCQKCGAELSEGANFCNSCGTRLEAARQQAPQSYQQDGIPQQPAVKAKRKKGCLIPILIALALIIVLIVLALGNGGEVSFSTANLQEMATASEVNSDTMKPVSKTSTFTTQAPVIYATVLVKNAPEGTKLSAKWIYLPESFEIAAVDFSTTEVNQYVAFNLTKPVDGFPPGKYSVEFFLGDKPAGSLEFDVTQ